MATRMQQRRGTATQWTDADPILASGEIGFETDTNQFKIGDGVNHWSDLSYFKNLEDLGGSLDDYVLLSTKGQANGVAELDNTGKIPSSQIPDLVGLDSEIASSVADAIATEVTNRNAAIATAVTNLEGEIATSVTNAVDALVDGAPAALDTLKEISDVVGDSGDIVGSLITNIGQLNTNIAATQSSLETHMDKTINVHGIPDVAELATKTYVTGELNDATTTLNATIGNNYTSLQGEIVQAVSDHADLTANVHGITNFGDLATKSYADTAVGNHANDTTDVHGIANFADLASKSYADDKADEARTAAESAATTALSAHESDTTSIHGISNTANLVYTDDSRLSDERTPSAGSVTAVKIASDAVETAKIKDLNVTTAKIADDAVTNAKLANDAVETAEIKDGAVTSAKIANTTIVDGNISDLADISQTKIKNLTSDLNLKAPLESPTFTGTVAGITKSMVGLGNVDNTSDENKPVSTAQAAAIATAKSEAIADATAQVNAVIASAPAALNTLDELAAALGDDANFATTVTNSLAAKAPTESPTFTGAVTVSASGIAFTDGTQTKEGVASRTTIQQKTASYTLSALTERDNMIEVSSTSATTITIPTNATLALPVGTSIDILQTNTGQVTIAGAAGVTVNGTPGLKLRTQWSSATLFKRATDTWVVMGDLSA